MAEKPGHDSKEHLDVENGLGEKGSLHDDNGSPSPAEPKPLEMPPEHVNPREGMARWRWPLTVVSLCTAALLYGLDTTIAADVQGAVYEDLGEIQNLPWVGLGFPMASVAVILLWGRLYGLYNVKWLTISSILIFEIGSAICGAANNMTALIFGRVIAGIGGSGMYLGALSYVSIFSTVSEASVLNAVTGFAWGVGAILGPLVGGGFSDSGATWRWAFYINLPLAALFAPVYFVVMPGKNPRPDLTFFAKLRQIDLVGAVLNGATFVLFMIVVSFSGSTFAWGSGPDIALWVVFAVVLVTYVVQQAFCIFTTPEKRIFPVHFLRSRTLLVLYLATAGASAAMSVTLYYIPLFFQFTRGDDSLEAAVRLLPFMIIMIFAVMLSGGLLPVVGRYSLFYIFGGACLVAGTAAMFTIHTYTPTAKIYGYEILVAFGAGFMFQNAYAIATAKVPNHDRPKAIGFINVSQIGTMAISLAIAGCIFQNIGFNKLKDAFAGSGYPDDYIRSALAGTISPIFSSNDQNTINTAVAVVADTIRKTMAVPLSGAALTFVCAFLLKHEKIALDVVGGG